MRYEYRTIRVERGAWREVISAVHGELAEEITKAGGILFGLWRGEIGWYSDQGVLMTAWPNEKTSTEGLDTVPHVEYSLVNDLEPTVRPKDSVAPSEDGVYAHRWFEVAAENTDEFVALSDEAWPGMEAAFPGVRIVGLWRLLGVPHQAPVRLLLLTRYPTLEAWEQSRPYNPALAPEAHEAREKFMRRAELTLRTIVRIGRLTSAN